MQSLVHPAQREVLPLAPEPILKGDGARKNDCERTPRSGCWPMCAVSIRI